MRKKAMYIALAVVVTVVFAITACEVNDLIEPILQQVAIDVFQDALDSRMILDDPGIHVILAGTGTPAISDRIAMCIRVAIIKSNPPRMPIRLR